MSDSVEKKRGPGRPPYQRKKTWLMSTSERAQAIALWRNGEATLSEIAKKLDRSEQTLKNLFKREGVHKGDNAAAYQQKVAAKVEEKMMGDAEVIAQRIRDTKEEHYKMAATLAKLTWKIIVTAEQQKQPIGTKLNDMKALSMATNVLKTAREERYAVLGLNEKEGADDRPLPDLVVQELTAEQIAMLHQAQQGRVSDDDFAELPDLDVEDMGGPVLDDEPAEEP